MERRRGFFGIGVFHSKSKCNIGTLMRSADQLGAAYVFTIGRRYEYQASDTLKTYRHMPVFNYVDFDDFNKHRPLSCPLVGVEMGGTPIEEFRHPERCIYLLGAEDHGLSKDVAERCERIVSLPSVRTNSFNVAVAGSLVMFDRYLQKEHK